MITISKTNLRDIELFLEQQWQYEDQVHYGQVEWQDIQLLFKAEENEKIVGTISGRLQSGVLLIEDIIVDRTKRGLGIGKLLVKKMEDYGREKNAHKIWGYTGKNWHSVKFYEALGYRQIGNLPNHFYKTDFVIIEKNL